MKVLFAASECNPFIKTSDLSDVLGSLPGALRRRGVEVAVVLPEYSGILSKWKHAIQHKLSFNVYLGWRRQYCGIKTLRHEDVTYYFIGNESYYGDEKEGDEGERFAFFCRAVLESLVHIDFIPDVLHCHGWEAGMIPALLDTQYRKVAGYGDIKTVFTVHDITCQGVFPWGHIGGLLGLDEALCSPDSLEFFGNMSFMKGGMKYADMVTTVSPAYAQEIRQSEAGSGLDGFINHQVKEVAGILNGIDTSVFDPETDEYIPANFSGKRMPSGKRACKRRLQEEMGLAVGENVPVICMVAPFTQYMGLELVEDAFDDIFCRDVQLVLSGNAQQRYLNLFKWGAFRYAQRCVYAGMNEVLRRLVFAGSDMLLMPSKFEPCGLTQMIAMRYGTLPIVHETGGLKDTVVPYNDYDGTGCAFSFASYSVHDMLFAIDRSIRLYGDKVLWRRLQKRAMAIDFSWENPAVEYEKVYKRVLETGKQGLHIPQIKPVKSSEPRPKLRIWDKEDTSNAHAAI